MRSPTPTSARQQLIAQLAEHVRGLSRARLGGWETVSTGCSALDERLPEQGLRRGTLVEWLEIGPGGGGGSLALAAAREACRDGGPLVVVDGASRFYPVAVAPAGIDLERLIVVRPGSSADESWALDQALRCPGVTAVLHWAERLSSRGWRRLQLAAESAGSLGLFVRPASARGDPSWADVRLLVAPLAGGASASGRRLRVEVLRLHGQASGQTLDVELDDETGVVRMVSALAPAVFTRRAAGAD